MSEKFFGKYKAIVRDLDDPRQMGRIRVQCPSVTGNGLTGWCQPCIPVAYEGAGDIALPRKGDTVWIEFEEGNLDLPIWVGNFYSQLNTPLQDFGYDHDTRVISWFNCKILMKENELTISVGDDTLMTLSDAGIIIMSGGGSKPINLN